MNKFQGHSRPGKKLLRLTSGVVFALAEYPGNTAADNQHGAGSAWGHPAVQGGSVKSYSPLGSLADGVLFGVNCADTVLFAFTVRVYHGVE